MAKRPVKDPFPEWPEWSTPKFWSFIRSGLRAKWSRWPPKYATLAKAKRDYKGPNPRQKYEFKCAKCKRYHPQKEVSVDHIEPAGTLRSFADLALFCEKLFVGTDKLQVLCDKCHKAKTLKERADSKNKEPINDDEHSNTRATPRKSKRANSARDKGSDG